MHGSITDHSCSPTTSAEVDTQQQGEILPGSNTSRGRWKEKTEHTDGSRSRCTSRGESGDTSTNSPRASPPDGEGGEGETRTSSTGLVVVQQQHCSRTEQTDGITPSTLPCHRMRTEQG